MRRLLVSTVAFLLLLLATACTPEQIDAFVRVNHERASIGLPMLDVSPEAAIKAQAWAERLSAEGRIWHSGTGIDGDWWWAVGENVGRGYSIEQVHEAFMASPSHRANILEPFWTHMGVGVAWNGDVVTVVHVFAG